MGIVSETFWDCKDMSMRAVLILSIFLGAFGTLVQTFDVDGLERMDPRSKVVEMRMDFDNLETDDDYGEDYGEEDDEILSRFDDLDSGFDGMDRFDEEGSETEILICKSNSLQFALEKNEDDLTFFLKIFQ